jgi:hypothetical protein
VPAGFSELLMDNLILGALVVALVVLIAFGVRNIVWWIADAVQSKME